MIDVIIYCPNITAFNQELIDGDFVDEQGNPVFAVNRTPRTYSPDKSKWAALVRLDNQQDKNKAIHFQGLEVLGTKEQVEASPDLLAKYLACYSRDPYTITDPETGEVTTITPPLWHGEFA